MRRVREEKRVVLNLLLLLRPRIEFITKNIPKFKNIQFQFTVPKLRNQNPPLIFMILLIMLLQQILPKIIAHIPPHRVNMIPIPLRVVVLN